MFMVDVNRLFIREKIGGKLKITLLIMNVVDDTNVDCHWQTMTDVTGNPEEERHAEFFYQPFMQEAVCRYFYGKVRSALYEWCDVSHLFLFLYKEIYICFNAKV